MRHFETTEIWNAKHHVIAEEGTEQALKSVDIGDIATRLRFVSDTNDRLQPRPDGSINPQQLQTLRQVKPEAAELLEAKWNED